MNDIRCADCTLCVDRVDNIGRCSVSIPDSATRINACVSLYPVRSCPCYKEGKLRFPFKDGLVRYGIFEVVGDPILPMSRLILSYIIYTTKDEALKDISKAIEYWQQKGWSKKQFQVAEIKFMETFSTEEKEDADCIPETHPHVDIKPGESFARFY